MFRVQDKTVRCLNRPAIDVQSEIASKIALGEEIGEQVDSKSRLSDYFSQFL
jgi:hypothetical protein